VSADVVDQPSQDLWLPYGRFVSQGGVQSSTATQSTSASFG
jgi:hypothetical protein